MCATPPNCPLGKRQLPRELAHSATSYRHTLSLSSLLHHTLLCTRPFSKWRVTSVLWLPVGANQGEQASKLQHLPSLN